MTISTETSLVNYIGNGVTTVFTFPFVGVSGADLEVIFTNSTGVSITLNPSQYTLIINTVPVGGLWGIGGSVTYPVIGSPIAMGTELTINRIVPYEQTVSIINQGAFYPQAVEQGLDLLELQIQQLETGLEYTINVPLTDTTPPQTLPGASGRANGFLGFDSSGQPIIVPSGPGSASINTANPRPVNTSGVATIAMSVNDSFKGITVYQTSGSTTTIQLPAGGGPYPVFDGSLNAGLYNLTVLPPAGRTVLSFPKFLLTSNGQSATFYNDTDQILVG